jgi:hypothetical protein
MFVTIDSAAGSTSAVPSPWIPRITMRKMSEVARPPASEAAVNTARPAMSTRRRPSKSAARPPRSRKPAKVSPYAVTSHCKSDSGKRSSRPMVVKATFTIVKSTIAMK